jgi:hypothetical protein
MCCADGYFIDCYGPFAANLYDANILKHILSSDEDLKKLLQPAGKIMLFSDRGTFKNSVFVFIPDKCLPIFRIS